MTVGHLGEAERTRNDDAARAAWLYYRAGMRQERIAEEMGISRQRVQRLVARATAEGLVRVRIEHPIAACEDLQADLCLRYGIGMARVAPALPGEDAGLRAMAPVAAQWLERQMQHPDPQVVGIGSGRALRAMAEQLLTLEGGQHRLVSLVGNLAPDGAAAFHEALMRLSERSGAAPYLMPVPTLARSEEEARGYLALPHVARARALAETATLALVGVGCVSIPTALTESLTPAQLDGLLDAGAVGEVCGHVFDAGGRFLDHALNRRMLGLRLPLGRTRAIGLAAGPEKVAPLRAALTGRLLSGLITDEPTARALLQG